MAMTKKYISRKGKESWPCTRCAKLKRRDEYARDGYYADGIRRYYAYCKVCKAKQSRKWYETNIEITKKRACKQSCNVYKEKGSAYRKHRVSNRAYQQTDKYKKWYFKNKLKKYNLTVEKYNEIFVRQNGQCAICFVNLDDIPSKQRHIDHAEIAGVRGILCAKCNHAIGLFKHKTHIIKRAAEYLEIFGRE